MTESEGVTEQLKADNQLECIRRIKNIGNKVIEFINKDLIQDKLQ